MWPPHANLPLIGQSPVEAMLPARFGSKYGDFWRKNGDEKKNKGMETEEQSKNQQQWTGINNQAETTNSRVQATKMGMSF